MFDAQRHTASHTPTEAPSRRIPAGRATRLDRADGELTVVSGRIWLTREGDTGDHIVCCGTRLQIAATDHAVIESADDGDAQVRWIARPSGAGLWVDGLRRAAWRGVETGAASLAAGFSAIERSASAHR